MPARRGRSKKDAVDRHAYDPAILHAKVIRLATDSAKNRNASQAAPKGIDADLVERLSKILDIAKQPGTSEDEAKCALRLIARMLSSDDEKKAETMSLDTAQEEIQKAGHSVVQICRRDGKFISVEDWIVRLKGAFEIAFNVKAWFTGEGAHQAIKITYYGLRTNVAAAAMSFEAIFNLALVWAANHSSKNCYLLGLSSSIKSSAKIQIELEENRALESEKRLIENLHSNTIKIKKERRSNVG